MLLLGKAKTFRGSALQEGFWDDERLFYGGVDDDDGSGILTYVRIEFAGGGISIDPEFKGLMLASVGRGTTIHHVEVNTTLDDCFAWYGGAVAAHHLICNNPGDDMFDVDRGYRGTLSTLLGTQRQAPWSADPNGLEFDGDLEGREPATDVTVTGVTLCGAGAQYDVSS